MKKIISRAPLRISLAGGGTDQYFFYKDHFGHVLNTAINLFTYTQIQTSDKVILTATDLNKSMVLKDLSASPEDEELQLLFLTYKKICEKYNAGKLLLVNLNTFSEVPMGSGLGASSALVVSMINAFKEYLNLPITPNLIAELAYEIERIDGNMDGGKQDQYSAAHGGINYYKFHQNGEVSIDSLQIKKYIINEIESSMLLVNLGKLNKKNINRYSFNIDEKIIAYKKISEHVYPIRDALISGDFQRFLKQMKITSMIKNSISEITHHDIVNRLINFVDEVSNENGLLSCARICGSGESGYILIYCDISVKNKIIKFVNELDFDYTFPKITLFGPETWYE
jgi:D-glycero-alpha-D-manno-heptose-7-phosphate kinase